MCEIKTDIHFTRSIGTVLLRYVFGFYFLVTLLVTLVQLVNEYLHTKKHIIFEIEKLENTFKEGFTTALWSYNSTQMQSMIAGLMELDIVSGVVIRDENGSIFAEKGVGKLESYNKEVFLTPEDINSFKGAEKERFQKLSQKITILKPVKKNHFFENIYEYSFVLNYKEDGVGDHNLGVGSIYCREDVIIERVKYGFILIIINSLIKTTALWIIFLIIANWLVTKPLQNLTRYIQENRPDHPVDKETLEPILKRKDEIGFLSQVYLQMYQSISIGMKTIQALNQNLDSIVKERTIQLSDKNKDIESIFANINQGIFILGKDLIIHPQYSKHLEKIFEVDQISSRSFESFFLQPSKLSIEKIEVLLKVLKGAIGELKYNFTLNHHLLPDEMDIEVADKTKNLQIDWDTIIDSSDTILKIIVVVRDISFYKEMEKKEEMQSLELKILHEILKTGERSLTLFSDSSVDLLLKINGVLLKRKNSELKSILPKTMQTLHTLKGNAKISGFETLARYIHQAESICSSLQNNLQTDNLSIFWDALQDVVNLGQKYRDILKESRFLYGNHRNIESFNNHLKYLEDMIASGKGSEEIYQQIQKIRKMNYGSYFSDLIDQNQLAIEEIARSKGMPNPKIDYIGDDFFLSKDVSYLIGALNHLISNSMVHGIEDENERKLANKPPGGRITIEAVFSKNTVDILVKDDGRGVNLNKLLKSEVIDQMAQMDHLKIEDLVSEKLFSSGFSTTEIVNANSGRGVGLGAARKLIEQNKGSIKLLLERDFQDLEKVAISFRISSSFNGAA